MNNNYCSERFIQFPLTNMVHWENEGENWWGPRKLRMIGIDGKRKKSSSYFEDKTQIRWAIQSSQMLSLWRWLLFLLSLFRCWLYDVIVLCEETLWRKHRRMYLDVDTSRLTIIIIIVSMLSLIKVLLKCHLFFSSLPKLIVRSGMITRFIQQKNNITLCQFLVEWILFLFLFFHSAFHVNRCL